MRRNPSSLCPLLFALAFAAPTVAGAHTTQVCWLDNSDGSTTFFAGTYHTVEEGIHGGLIIDGNTYNFTAMIEKAALPPGAKCNAKCPDAGLDRYQVVTVPNVSCGNHSVRPSCTSNVECAWAGCWPQTVAACPCGTSYAIFANQQAQVRDRAVVAGGCTIGSNDYAEVGADAIVTGDVVAHNNSFLRERASITGNVTAGGSVWRQNNVTVTGTVSQSQSVPLVPLPAYTVNAGGNDYNIWPGGGITLGPGSYGNFHAFASTTVVLSAGTYNFSSFVLEPDVHLTLDVSGGPIAVNIQGETRLGDRTHMNVNGGGASSVGWYSNASWIMLGTDSDLHGTFTAPSGTLHMFSRARLTGALRGSNVWVEPDARLACVPASCGQMQNQWTQRTPAHVPPARYGNSLAYDSTRKTVVMFGGSDDQVRFQDTWEWDGSDWKLQSPAVSPSRRAAATMVYDSARQVMLLYGGQSPTGGCYDDTWEYDGINWKQLQPPTNPGGRCTHEMAYDSVRKVAVLFGGTDGNSYLNETWEYDGAKWTRRTPSSAPPPRTSFGMAYDASRQRTVLFGGYTGACVYCGETWEYDGNNWTQRVPPASPPGRWWNFLAYDSDRQVTVLFGGTNGGNPMNDTWEWNGLGWTDKQPTVSPGRRYAERYVYDAAHARVVLFGGNSTTGVLNDTWVYGGP